MAATVSVNLLTVVHKSSDGVAIAFPDVCKTPSPGGPVPIPYPNIAQSQDTASGTKTVKADGNSVMIKSSNFATSSGDEAGSAQGVASNKIKGKANPLVYSFDVKFDGENVFRMTDLMLQNSGSPPNTPPAAEVQPPAPVVDVEAPATDAPPSLDEVEWTTTDAKCGDEVQFRVRTSNVPAGTTITVAARRRSGDRPLLALFRGELAGDSARGRWVTRTGRQPDNPTPVALTAFGRGLAANSTANLDIEVPAAARQAGSKLRRRVPKVVRQLQPDGSYSYVRDPSGGFWGWDYGHELEIVDGVFRVTCKIKLVGRNGVSITNKRKNAWKREIEAIWNGKWREHRVACARGADCDCPGGCCLFPVQIVCEFVSSGEYAEVEVWPGNPCDYGSHDKWWNSGTWFLSRCGHEGNGDAVRAHEFGHNLGLYDEYSTGGIFVATDATGAVSGQPPRANVPGSLMCDGTDINENHLDEFHTWFAGQVPDEYHRERIT